MSRWALSGGTRWMESIRRYCGTLTPVQDDGRGQYLIGKTVMECPHMHKEFEVAWRCAELAAERWERTGRRYAWPVESGRKIGSVLARSEPQEDNRA